MNEGKKYISVRNKLTDLENEFLVTEGKWGGGIDREFETDVYILLYLKQITKRECCSTFCNNLNGKIIWKRANTSIHRTENINCKSDSTE